MAELLGNPLGKKLVLDNTHNLNNINDGIYSYHNTNLPVNSYGYNSLVIQFTSLLGNAYKYQICFACNERKVAIRFYNGSWSSWCEL